MSYTDYEAPGVSIIIERQQAEQQTVQRQQFYPVFVGTGMTSSSRDIAFNDMTADVSAFPKVTFTPNFTDLISQALFGTTAFTLKTLVIQKIIPPSAGPTTTLVAGTDYTVDTMISTIGDDGNASFTVDILNASITDTDLVYNFTLTASNGNDDFDLRLLKSEDQFFAKDIVGPYFLTENDTTITNDVAIAAAIAFKLKVPAFYYLEVSRTYGSKAADADIVTAMEKIYYRNDAYRIIPLTDGATVATALQAFVTSIANPTDKRETVGFVSYAPANITDITSMTELVTKVGGYSASLNSTRIMNVFGGKTVDLTLDGVRHTLPWYFMNAALASMDTVLGMAVPMTLQTITAFDSIDCPRFRPADWNKLAKTGVWIVKQDDPSGPIVVRHQLTTAQSDNPNDQEYSIIKNLDGMTALFRDRLSPYAGKTTITQTTLDKINGTTTSTIEEAVSEGLAVKITQVSPWAVRTVPVDGSTTQVKTNLVTRLKPDLAYPADNLDVYLLI